MENLLREYLERAFSDRGEVSMTGNGPVVTLSREFGCPSKLIAQRLATELNRQPRREGQHGWRVISKEVVEATARQLGMDPVDAVHILNFAGKGLIEDVLASFTTSYVNDHRVRKTILNVVRSIADQGHVILVGRGGVGILRNRPNTLHVRLLAPTEWRIRSVCESKKISVTEASTMIDEIDRNRVKLLELVTGEKFSPFLFDVAYHCHSLSNDEIVSSIMGLLKARNLA